ncbi:hypothetical protein L9F63_015129, partial [Diploptera punctata]
SSYRLYISCCVSSRAGQIACSALTFFSPSMPPCTRPVANIGQLMVRKWASESECSNIVGKNMSSKRYRLFTPSHMPVYLHTL